MASEPKPVKMGTYTPPIFQVPIMTATVSGTRGRMPATRSPLRTPSERNRLAIRMPIDDRTPEIDGRLILPFEVAHDRAPVEGGNGVRITGLAHLQVPSRAVMPALLRSRYTCRPSRTISSR